MELTNQKANPRPPPKPPSPLEAQLHVWFSALSLLKNHGGNQARFWGTQLAIGTLVRAACQLLKMRVNEASVVHQNLGQVRLFFRTQVNQVVLAAFLSLLQNWIGFAQRQVALQWRSGLTRSIHQAYFQGTCFYDIAQGGGRAGAITDADVRIAEDIPKVATNVTNLLVTLANGLLDMLMFTVFVGRSGRVGIGLGVLTQVYVVSMYIMNNYIVPVDWVGITGPVAATNSKLQQQMSRAETHASTICALQGGKLEAHVVSRRFREAVLAKVKYFVGQHWNDAFMYFFVSSTFDRTPLFWCSFLYFTASVLQNFVRRQAGAPQLLDPHISSPEIAKGWGMIIRYHGSMLNIWLGGVSVANALQQVMLNYASIGRIQKLMERLQAAAQPRPALIHSEDANLIKFEGVDVQTPTGIDLVRGLTFSVHWGENLLLTGHNGAGKSSIFRCLAGLWQVKSGSIWTPNPPSRGLASSVCYLPQRPYNTVGTLFDQLCYPDQPPDSFTEEKLRLWLDYVDLGYLADRPGALVTETDWQQVLSLGEQQRLSILRLFFHRPKFAVLDECTSAVTGEIEQRLFEICIRLQISCITIAHRPALKKYHHTSLTLTGCPKDSSGGYSFSKLADAPKAFNHTEAAHQSFKKNSELDKVISQYFEERSLKLRQKSNNELFQRRAALLDIQGVQKEKKKRQVTPSLSNLSKVLKIVLSHPGTFWRSCAIAACMLVRTHVYWKVWLSVGKVILGSITFDSHRTRSGLLANMFYVCLQFAVDRTSKHLCQQLMVRVWESLSLHIHKLYFQEGALHYAMTSRPPLVHSPAAGASQTLAFAEALTNSVDEIVKPVCIGMYLLGRAVWSDGRMVGLTALSTMMLQKLSAVLIGPNIKEFTRRAMALEAKFKTLHARFRQNLEPIAFSGGGVAEQRVIDKAYEALEKHTVHDAQAGVAYQTVSTFMLAPDCLPLSIMRALSAAHVWNRSKSLEVGGISAVDFEDMWYYDQCTKLGFSTLRAFAALPDKLAMLEGLAQGLMQLVEGLTEAAAAAPAAAAEPSAGDSIVVGNVNLVSPQGSVLAMNMNFSVQKANSLLVTGPNASGKTVLAGLLSGLWPIHGGSISICGGLLQQSRPHIADLAMVSQRPYLAPGGLASNVAYPSLDCMFDDPRIRECVDAVGLSHLVERYGMEVGPETPWDEVLSGGEQQRLCLARCLFHRPRFALLDECTSMISQESEDKLYDLITKSNVVPITFSQRLLLPELHPQELRLGADTEDGWSLVTQQTMRG